MSGGPERLEILAAILMSVGVLLCGFSTWRLARAVRACYTWGAPYRRGQIADRLVALLLTFPVLLAGLAFVFLAVAQSAFQLSETTTRVGLVATRRSSHNRVAMRFVPDERYPGRQVLEGEVIGARWAVAGDFIDWDPSVRWLGLRSGHRLRYLLGTPDAGGLSRERDDPAVLEPLPPAAAALTRLAPFIPYVNLRTETSSWYPPAEREVRVLYAVGSGYIAELAPEE